MGSVPHGTIKYSLRPLKPGSRPHSRAYAFQVYALWKGVRYRFAACHKTQHRSRAFFTSAAIEFTVAGLVADAKVVQHAWIAGQQCDFFGSMIQSNNISGIDMDNNYENNNNDNNNNNNNNRSSNQLT
ncbi:MAG: hypothetical protein AAGG65_16795, partial [Pseudomonadota bacterium]